MGFQQYVARLLPLTENGGICDKVFNELALELFELQREHNAAYRVMCERTRKVQSWQEIPAVPTRAFKELELTSIPPGERTKEFRSSGTTRHKPSRHFHSAESLRLYETLAAGPLKRHFFEEHMIPITLTPHRDEAPHSSLAHMFGTLKPLRLGRADWTVSGVVVGHVLRPINKPVALMGTAFNFVQALDTLEPEKLTLAPGSRVLETGGYKGRTREMSRAGLHELICGKLGISEIVMEYGMCELSSQAYAHEDGIFEFPDWARVQIVSPETGREAKEGETGLVRVFDLANAWSVLAIQTEDLGVRRGHKFELLGRASGAEARGCSLMSR